MKKFSAVHLLHDVGIALMSADEERDLAEFDRLRLGGKDAGGSENDESKNAPVISFHGC